MVLWAIPFLGGAFYVGLDLSEIEPDYWLLVFPIGFGLLGLWLLYTAVRADDSTVDKRTEYLSEGNQLILSDAQVQEIEQFRLEARVGDIDQALDDFRVTLATQARNAVLRYNHIPQMLGYGDVAIKRHDIGFKLLASTPGAANA